MSSMDLNDTNKKGEEDTKPVIATKDDLMNVEEGEDCVVREIDVYFTPFVNTKTQTYAMYYPLRQYWYPYELDTRCNGIRVQPDGLEIEIDLSLDIHSKNYDPQWTCKMNMDKEKDLQTLSSTWSAPKSTYALGILTGNMLHLNFIHAILHLQPSMGRFYADKSARDNSWIPLTYYSSNSDKSARYKQMLMKEDSHPIDISMSPSDYINIVCPVNSSKGPSKRGSCTMSYEIREALRKVLEVVFKSHPMCSFQTICDSLRNLALNTSNTPKEEAKRFMIASKGVDAPIHELKAIINEVAIDVHGVYVSKSSSLHPECDQFRRIVIDLLRAKPNAKLKKAQIFEAAKNELKREVTHSEYSKVLHELCEDRRIYWVLKNVNGPATI